MWVIRKDGLPEKQGPSIPPLRCATRSLAEVVTHDCDRRDFLDRLATLVGDTRPAPLRLGTHAQNRFKNIVVEEEPSLL